MLVLGTVVDGMQYSGQWACSTGMGGYGLVPGTTGYWVLRWVDTGIHAVLTCHLHTVMYDTSEYGHVPGYGTVWDRGRYRVQYSVPYSTVVGEVLGAIPPWGGGWWPVLGSTVGTVVQWYGHTVGTR